METAALDFPAKLRPSWENERVTCDKRFHHDFSYTIMYNSCRNSIGIPHFDRIIYYKTFFFILIFFFFLFKNINIVLCVGNNSNFLKKKNDSLTKTGNSLLKLRKLNSVFPVKTEYGFCGLAVFSPVFIL